jgi:hypothetical protein
MKWMQPGGNNIPGAANTMDPEKEQGTALLTTLIALALFSLLGLYMTLNAAAGLNISDNYESQVHATYAALAGINHARVLVRGLALNDCLRGPDGSHGTGNSYITQAKSYGFRNPVSLITALALDINDPGSAVTGIPDDGILNTGFYAGVNGIVLIPVTGAPQTESGLNGADTVITARYFVKATDNNGEASELLGDPQNDPFSDGDGEIIVRSIGVSRTAAETTGTARRQNSIAIFESRFRRLSTFDPGPALTIIGSQITAELSGAYEITGGLFPGVGTIDIFTSDGYMPDQMLKAAAGPGAKISGAGLTSPSIQEIGPVIKQSRDQALLLDPRHLYDFTVNRARRFADLSIDSDQIWAEANAPYLGFYDLSEPLNAPVQDPKLVVVNGDLRITGAVSGGGLLIVTGHLLCTGSFTYNGLILVLGSGGLSLSGPGSSISGGIVMACLNSSGGNIGFGIPALSIAGVSRIVADARAVKMAIGLIPVSQTSFREIAGLDP